MYVELIIVYVLLAIFALLHIVTLFILLNLMKARKKNNAENQCYNNFNIDNEGIGVVFCKKCNIGFDAKYNECPKCGLPR